MNPALEQLITLQAIDLDLKRLRNQLLEAPRRVSAAETAKRAADAKVAATQDALAREAALRRRQESDVADHRSKIARLRKQLEAATSAQQVAAYEREIAFGDQSIATLEDAELASMERTEALEAALNEAKHTLDSADATVARARGNAATLQERNTPAITALEKERDAIRTALASSEEGSTLLASYDRVTKARGSGLSEAVDHKCSACQMMVRPQRWNDLTGREHANEIYTCETCARLLFWDPRRDAPGPWAPGERLAQAYAAQSTA